MLNTSLWVIGSLLHLIASLAIVVFIIRVILDWVAFFQPHWHPRGLVLITANLVHLLTDPPVRLLRRYIPPLRLGNGISLDIGFMLLFLVCMLAQNLGAYLAWSV